MLEADVTGRWAAHCHHLQTSHLHVTKMSRLHPPLGDDSDAAAFNGMRVHSVPLLIRDRPSVTETRCTLGLLRVHLEVAGRGPGQSDLRPFYTTGDSDEHGANRRGSIPSVLCTGHNTPPARPESVLDLQTGERGRGNDFAHVGLNDAIQRVN